MYKKILNFALVIGLFTSCSQTVVKQDILQTNMDTAKKPNDDFFEYANGGWISKNPIPNDETVWGIGNLVQKELYTRLLKINEDAVKKEEKTGSGQQIGDFWFSAMDTNTIEKKGIQPLESEMKLITDIKNTKELMLQVAHMHTYGCNVFFDEGAGQDQKKSDLMAYMLGQGGLGMPIRNYYFDTDERTVKIRNEYPKFISKIFQIIGIDATNADKKAATIFALETEMAVKHRKLEDLRDPYANYNKMALTELNKKYANIDFEEVLKKIGVTHIDSVVVGQPEFFETLNSIIIKTDIETLKDYLTFHLITTFAPYLNKHLSETNFDFYAKTMNGAKEQHPRWRRVLDAEEKTIGDALGQLFVKQYFKPEAKQRYEKMVENVQLAYKARMEKLDWMTDSTKQKAIHKLMSIKKKVGYPEKWKDFSTLKIDKGDYVLNILRANEWWNTYQLNKLGKPVDREEWDMTPQTYNAYYNPSNNEIVLPAAQMTVPGYSDEELDDALVYGYTAASTIGHEITHGFDDQGRQYDEKGNLNCWWSATDSAQFAIRSQKLVEQFNKMVPIDTMHINGKATLGENLADLGGILIGLDAFKQTETYKKGEKISGMSPLQRFFMGYSLGWLMQERPERLAAQILTNVHAPAKNRVNGPFPNVSDFYQAFGIKENDKMFLPDNLRVHLW